jgi:hypothetical protein
MKKPTIWQLLRSDDMDLKKKITERIQAEQVRVTNSVAETAHLVQLVANEVRLFVIFINHSMGVAPLPIFLPLKSRNRPMKTRMHSRRWKSMPSSLG